MKNQQETKNALKDEWNQEIRALYLDGYGCKAILKHLRESKEGFTGKSCASMARRIRKLGLKMRGMAEGKARSQAFKEARTRERTREERKRMSDAQKGRGLTISNLARKRLRPKEKQASSLGPLLEWRQWHRKEYASGTKHPYWRWRYRNDPEFRLKEIHRRRFNKWRNIWRGQGNEWGPGSKQMEALLGCSNEQAKQWIESQFTEGMAWDKIGMGEGKVSIDHVVPCSWFDHSDEQQAELCWNYQNLRPMWHLENVSRNDSGEDIEAHFASIPQTGIVKRLLNHAQTMIERKWLMVS